MKLALAIIAKDQVEEVKRIYTAYAPFFDSVDVAVDQRLNEFQYLATDCPKLKIYDYSGEPRLKNGRIDFAHKRNWLANKIDADYYFRLDTDDAIVGVENLHKVMAHVQSQDISMVYTWYDYAKDSDGNVNAGHYRETIIKKDGNLYWNKSIHENVLAKSQANYRYVVEDSIKIDHLVSEGHAEESLARNIDYFIEEYNQDKENTDPRTIAYLGRTFADLGDYDKAIFFLQKHIEKSGWDEDRYMTWVRLADIFMRQKQYKEAISACTEALIERADFPDAYLKLHEIYFETQSWGRAIEWGKMGMAKPQPKTFMLLDPSAYTWRPAFTMAVCYLQMGDSEKAKELFDYAQKLAPNFRPIREMAELFNEASLHKKFVDKFLWILGFMKEKGAPKKKILDLFNALPDPLDKHEMLVRFKNDFKDPVTWGEKSVVIYCPAVFEEWAAPSVISGIGGSEEAVIYLSKELAKLGYQVTVYNECGEMEGTYDGVQYRNYHEFNVRDNFNVLVSWRSNIFNQGVTARKRIVWLHDVPYSGWFKTQDEMDTFDKIVVLSQFHKSLLPKEVPAEKIFVSANGINQEDFADSGVVREPHRVIYASSYNRGLEQLLTIWPDVRRAVPDAELHVYYGWNNFDKLAKRGETDPMWKEKIEAMMGQPGIVHHGRVGHRDLVAEFQKASVWAYPCTFPEIHCITALKAQACNTIPVITTYSAVSETTLCGFFVPGHPVENRVLETYKNELIRVLSSNEVMDDARKQLENMDKSKFGWDWIAKQWSEELLGVECVSAR